LLKLKLKLKFPETKSRGKSPEKKLLLKKINGSKKFGEPKFEKKAFVIFYRAGKNDVIDLLSAKTLIFKLFLFKAVFIAVTVPDIKLNTKLEKFKLIINLSRKLKIFDITVTFVTVKTENKKINLINCAGCKAKI